MKKGIDYNVETLRGFCAVMVLVHHAIIYSHVLNPGFEFRAAVMPYTPSGHLMVLIFFMLSGYVIGLTSLNKINFSVPDYLKRRLVRLYPIYIIAILLTVILFTEKWEAITTTLFFTQNILSNGLVHNDPLWSLNHEVVYYLLVIPILLYKIRSKYVFGGLAFLLMASLIKLQFPMIMEGYLVGFVFWLTGFALSKVKLKEQVSLNITPDKLVSVFLLLLSCDFLNLFNLSKIFSHFNLLHGVSHYPLDAMVSINDLSGFPFCLYAIVSAAAINVKWNKLLTIFVYAACWGHLLILVLNGSFFKVNIFYAPAVFLMLSTGMFFNPVKIFRSMSLLASAGSISYAMYVVHMPILQLFGKFTTLSGSSFWFFLRFIGLILIVIAIAYLLEKKLQPIIKEFFTGKKRNIDPVQAIIEKNG